MSRSALLDEVCGICGAPLRDVGDEMRCPDCYPCSYSEEEAAMHSEIQPWLRQQLESREETNLRQLADEAAAHFVADPTFLQTTVARLIKAAAREEAARILRSQRGGKVLLGDVVVSRAGLAARAQSSPFWGWTEQVGTRRIPLPDMTRQDLLLAANERRARGRRELAIAGFWQRLSEMLEEGQSIRTRFSPEEIDRLAAKRASLDSPEQPKALPEGTA